jgi:UDP-N-acetylglucosamine 3-dehydrogenase
MTKQVRVGIIGTGAIADMHANAYRACDNARIVAVSDIDKALLEKKKLLYGAQASYTRCEDLLRDNEVDAVDICVPVNLHARIAVAAAEADKHLLLEKPMALTLQECDDIISAARKNSVNLTIVHNQLFYPPHNEAKRLVETEIGKTIMLVTRLHSGSRIKGWRADPKIGGGWLMEAGIHRLYLARYLMGEIEQVFCALGKTSPDHLGEDMAVVSMKFLSGAYGSLSSSAGGPYPLWDDRTEVVGTDGMIIVNGVEDQIIPSPPLLFYKDGRWVAYTRAKSYARRKDNRYEVEADFPNLWPGGDKLIPQFVESIINDTGPLVSGEEGKRLVQIVLACHESAKTGLAVNV